MRRLIFAAVIAATAGDALAANVGVAVTVGDPGYYGRIDIGNFPQPQLIYLQPVVIEPVPVGVVPQPLYLHVPPGHAKNWRKHCAKYNACGHPVYFVKVDGDDDYERAKYREYQEKKAKKDKHHSKGHGKGDHDN